MAHTIDSFSVCSSCKASLLEHINAGNSIIDATCEIITLVFKMNNAWSFPDYTVMIQYCIIASLTCVSFILPCRMVEILQCLRIGSCVDSL